MAQVDPWDETVERPPPKGIGGWLWLPLLQLIAAPVMIVMTAITTYLKPLARSANVHALIGQPVFLVLRGIGALLLLALLLFAVICLVQLFRKKSQLPRLMTIYYGLDIAINVLVPIQFALYPDFFIQVVDQNATSGQIGFQSTAGIVVCGIFILYFGISERVKNTFVR